MKRLLRVACLLVALSLCAWTLCAEPPPSRYTNGTPTDPGGSGKFYMDREISMVMGHEGAGWLERPEREKEEQPKKLLKMLEIKEGMVAADIGAGSGYHSFRMAEKVGAKGKVLAVDIQKELLD